GITMSEIADLIEKMYGHHYTPQTMSNMTKSFTEEVTSFKERELHDRYAAIYMDATYIPLKRKTVAKEAIHIVVGIRPDGSKEVLSYAIAPTESITIWEEILIDLQERGVKNVLLFITDGLKGMAGAVQRFYPKARFQHCCVHVSRNISHKVRVDDRKEVCDDFKMVYQASSKKAALEARGAFAEKWKTSYPKMVESILSNDYLLTFYDFPLAIRKTIYSTNLIESFNKQIKKYSHRKEQFQNEESMERFLVSSFDTYNQKFLGRSHKGFQQAEGELEQMLSQPMEN
ncbi:MULTISPECIES: IS256 family transposase, partial [Enterococcus]